jgi:hypothetical protein
VAIALAASAAIQCGAFTGSEDTLDAASTTEGGASDAPATSTEGSVAMTDAGVPTSVDAADAGAPKYECNGAPVTTCALCSGKPSLCGTTNTCVQTCSTDCTGFRVACFRCDTSGANVVGTCEAENDAGYCMNDDYAPGIACPCENGDASFCPGDYQKCVRETDASPYACHSCGELVTSGGANCKGGGQCDFKGSATDHLTCH